MKKGAAKYIAGGAIVSAGIVLIIIACCIGGWGILHKLTSVNFVITPGGFSEGVNTAESISDINFENIKLDIAYGEVTIKTADAAEVSIEAENVIEDYLKYETDGSTLSVSYNGIFTLFSWNTNTKISITIPESMSLANVDIKNGAGKMTISGITADTVDIETGAGQLIASGISSAGNTGITTGAGEVKITDLSCDKLDIESGVGAVNAEGVTCSGLDLDTGVGGFTFSGSISGNADIDTGVGAVTMLLNGNSSDYSFMADSGVGKVTVNGSAPVQNSSAKYTFSIDNGVGAVNIEFSENS